MPYASPSSILVFGSLEASQVISPAALKVALVCTASKVTA